MQMPRVKGKQGLQKSSPFQFQHDSTQDPNVPAQLQTCQEASFRKMCTCNKDNDMIHSVFSLNSDADEQRVRLQH